MSALLSCAELTLGSMWLTYRSVPVPVQAIQLCMDIRYSMWGGEQVGKNGDWLICKGGETYTCDADVFAATYVSMPTPGWFTKEAYIEAARATRFGSIPTLEGSTSVAVGDYLVRGQSGDLYSLTADKLRELYTLGS